MIAYLITNLKNGHRYVGVTTKSLKRRWTNHLADAAVGSSRALHRAIRKYGRIQFAVEQIASGLSVDGLLESERKLIDQLGTMAPNGYNMTVGGDGTPGLTHSEISKRKIGAFWKGRRRSKSTRLKMSLAHTGKTLTAEHRRKMAAAKLGKQMPPRSCIHKKRISAGLRAAWARRKSANGKLL